jgi:hypothetical protein
MTEHERLQRDYDLLLEELRLHNINSQVNYFVAGLFCGAAGTLLCLFFI